MYINFYICWQIKVEWCVEFSIILLVYRLDKTIMPRSKLCFKTNLKIAIRYFKLFSEIILLAKFWKHSN